MHRAPLFLLYLNVLVIATCGLIYELLAGTLASYVLGDSVTQFSLVIGVYLSALGVGAWVSGFVKGKLARCFLAVELAVALVGGFSAPILYLAFAYVSWFQIALFGMVFAIGVLVGLELPLLMRILKDQLDFSELVAKVLTFDYIGALLASVLFPVLLVPRLGLIRTSLLFGMLNAAVGFWGTWLLRPLLSAKSLGGIRGRAVLVAGLLVVAFIKADRLTSLAEENLFPNQIVHAETTPYQRIVMTKNLQGFQLYLNGNLQFNSADEYRYHESLVHPAVSLSDHPKNVLVMGGGDGLAVRELLRYPEVESVTLVDIDPKMTTLADRFPPLRELSNNALTDPRVTVVNTDAFVWVEQSTEQFDLCVIDFPDPGTFSVGKLYSRLFFGMLRQRLKDTSCVSVQCTSPLAAPKSFWCIINTMESAGFNVRAFHAPVPSFGVWGFAMASPTPFDPETVSIPPAIETQLRYLNTENARKLFVLPSDLQRVETELNRLNNQILVRYYESEWKKWN
ncbi:MAG: polyamine aminopropyltransferase [Planctomycetaceae bacterium]